MSIMMWLFHSYSDGSAICLWRLRFFGCAVSSALEMTPQNELGNWLLHAGVTHTLLHLFYYPVQCVHTLVFLNIHSQRPTRCVSTLSTAHIAIMLIMFTIIWISLDVIFRMLACEQRPASRWQCTLIASQIKFSSYELLKSSYKIHNVPWYEQSIFNNYWSHPLSTEHTVHTGTIRQRRWIRSETRVAHPGIALPRSSGCTLFAVGIAGWNIWTLHVLL